MEQIEVSIRLSMSGVSYQPSDSSSSNNNNVSSSSVVPAPAVAQSKVIPQQPGFYHSTSNTPTDVMELSSTCVC